MKGKEFFSNQKIKYLLREPKGGYGTQIEKDKYSIQKFFENHKIPLVISEMHSFSDLTRLKDFLINHLSQNHDIILRYNNQLLKRANQKNTGHFAVVADLDCQTDTRDPGTLHF